ncbi:thyrotropin-releasing hormone receptor isoform X2 [Solenopsis invicta]|uniref:thyrotropin-releasing hormone receptor isoform X2 n=1 Tax=Solenopsis invicta TaxID=13686 RepID=UPI00193EC171|nr:thyrotropin-releasing hormone receptor isoform X2 [Solenopsis invicta]
MTNNFLGCLGNCLSVYAFLGTKLRYSSSSIYLGALAINDNIFLLLGVFIPWLRTWGVNIFNQQGFCQFIQYFGYVSSFLNAWLVVAFTVERYIAVKWPLRRQFLCTVVRAKMTVTGLTVSAILLSSPIIYLTRKTTDQDCGSNKNIENDENLRRLSEIYNTIDSIVSFVVPLITIVIFNMLIARNIYKLDNIRRTLTIESNVSNDRAHASRDRMPQTKVTKMLLVVSTTFLCLNLPAVVIRIIVFIYNQKIEELLWLYWAQQIVQALFYTSFGINFILYCASGQNFRREILRMCGKRSRRNTTSGTITSHGNQCVSELTSRSNLTTKRQYSVETTLSTELSADAKTSSKRIMI